MKSFYVGGSIVCKEIAEIVKDELKSKEEEVKNIK